MNIHADFIIRVYALIVNNAEEILLSDEHHFDMFMTKFPGGGLEYGEGLIDCLQREIFEECKGQEITNIEHFYTTDFYQKALFFENKQLISIYYTCTLKQPVKVPTSVKKFDFQLKSEIKQSFRWAKIKNLTEDDFALPIDKFVLRKFKHHYK